MTSPSEQIKEQTDRFAVLFETPIMWPSGTPHRRHPCLDKWQRVHRLMREKERVATNDPWNNDSNNALSS